MSELSDILRKVQALITQADHPNTGPAEAESFRMKAEALMFKYRIDESQLSSADKAKMGLDVQWASIVLCDAASEFRSYYVSIIHQLIAHLEVKADYVKTENRRDGDMVAAAQDYEGRNYVVNVVGYESDLVFIQAMYSAARLAFSGKLEPRYDPTLSDQVNAYIMRSAGMEGRRIALAIYGRDDKALRPKVRKMFADESALRGEDAKVLLGRGSNMALFRESYAQGFVSELGYRLATMRQARAAVSQGLVLAGRADAIAEAFYERFPERRPKPVDRQIGEANTKTCVKCSKAASGYCRDHGWMRPRKSRVRYANGDGLARGRSAARSVDLGVTNRQVK